VATERAGGAMGRRATRERAGGASVGTHRQTWCLRRGRADRTDRPHTVVRL